MLPTIHAPIPTKAAHVRQVVQVDQTLRVEAEGWDEDLETGLTTYFGNVRATYGPTVLTATKIVVDSANKRLKTVGPATLSDPEGTIHAEDLTADWTPDGRGGTAKNATVTIGETTIKARSITIKSTEPVAWTLLDAELYLASSDNEKQKILSEKVRVYPGRYGIADKPRFVLFGAKVGLLPYYRFNLDNRVTGLQLPSFAERGGKLGVSWVNSFLLSEKLSAAGAVKVFPGSAPEGSLLLTYAPLDPKTKQGLVVPRNDLDERFEDGWFDDIGVRNPSQEVSEYQNRKASLSLGSSLRQTAVARQGIFREVSKALELVGETGGPVGGGGYRLTGRYQQIKGTNASPYIGRGVLEATWVSQQLEFGNGLSAGLRADGFATASENGQYAFARGLVGLSHDSGSGFRIGLAYAAGFQSGTPDFAFDRIGMSQGMMFRADYDRKPYRLSYLGKYDLRSGRWIDHEWEIAFLAGTIEPFFQGRQFPREFRFGIRFRLDDFIERVQSRSQNRSPESKERHTP